MSYGYTGLVLKEEANFTGFFKKTVSIFHLETFETSRTLTSSWHKIKSFKFKKSYTAKRFLVCVNSKRINRAIKILKQNNLM